MNPWRQELNATLRLAAPIVLVQMGQYLMGYVDQIFVGEHSVRSFVGIGLGTTWFWLLVVLGQGTLAALDPLVAQAVGREDVDAARAHAQRGLGLALWISIPVSLLALLCEPVLIHLGQPPEVAERAAAYTIWSLPGLPFFLAFVAVRQSLQAFSVTKPILWSIGIANLVNVFGNWLFVFGNLGAPSLGLEGSALASNFARVAMLVGLFVFARAPLRKALLPFDRHSLDPRRYGRLLRLGLPIGIQYSLEVSVFSATLLAIGSVHGELGIAGHKVAISMATMSFMGVLGISAAAAVRVGYACGREDERMLRRASLVGVGLGVAWMLLAAAVFLAIPRALSEQFTDDEQVLALAVSLIPIAAAFQIVDGIQGVAVGVLRGMADTRAPALLNLLGFWVLGFPIGVWLDHAGHGIAGRWWGLTIGLLAVATLAGLRIRFRLRDFTQRWRSREAVADS